MEAPTLVEPASPSEGRAPAPLPPAAQPWPLWQRIAFRFFSIYFVLNLFPFPIGWLPKTEVIGEYLWQKPLEAAGEWLGREVYGLTGNLVGLPNGSGDQTAFYIQASLLLIVAALATVIWSLVQRRRQEHERLHGWVRVYIRYGLALFLLSYGMVKVFKSQFPAPSLGVLLQPYGESSPMRLLWTFMGHSTPYTMFVGGVEVLGGLLLMFRRTTLLGALVSAGAMLHVAVLNFCYDVPVKILSTFLFLMAVYLLAPDLPRLVRFFLLHRAGEGRDYGPPPFSRPWMNRARPFVKGALILGVLGYITWNAYDSYRTWGDGAPKPALYGVYEVETFVRDGVTVPPALTEAKRWRWIVFDRGGAFSAVRIDGSRARLRVEADDGKTLQMKGPPKWDIKIPVTYQRPDADHLVLDGRVDDAQVKVTARRADMSKFLLISRGFHWINEFPFNR